MAERIVPEKKAEASYRPYCECTEDGCQFGSGPSINARDWAKDHIRYTGHSVRLISEKVALWGPK